MNFETIKAFNIDHHHHQFVAVVLWRWANCLYPIHLILWGSLCTLERCSVVEYIGAQLFSHVILDTFDSIWQSLPIGKIQCSAKLFSHSIRYIYFYEVVVAYWRMLCSWIHWSKIILTCQFLIHLILWALGVHIMCALLRGTRMFLHEQSEWWIELCALEIYATLYIYDRCTWNICHTLHIW